MVRSSVSCSVFIVLVATGLTAAAQSPASNELTPPPLVAPTPVSTPPVSFGYAGRKEDNNLPPRELVSRSSAHLSRMRDVLKTVFKYLEEAREKRDVIKLNCVNEKLTAVKGLLKVSEQADVTMQEALARRDEEAGRYEYDKVSIARGRVDALLGESEACVGELSVYAGDTVVEVLGGNNRDIPNPTTPIDNGGVVRPPSASPGQGDGS
ncbi:MAG: hypothetical protein H7Z43_08740 [Clostridia bacterium]|nr:hypothetical protein [Deltaproteobacteria bacterium]